MKASKINKITITCISVGMLSTGYAAIIGADPFEAAGTAQPANGVYQAGASIAVSPNSSVTGGSIVGDGGSWLAVAGPTDGSTTSLYKPQTAGLTKASVAHPSGGSLEYGGYHDTTTRRVRRPLASYTGNSVYYMSGLMRINDVAQGGSPDPIDPNGKALMGFTDNYSNAEFEGGSDFYGLMWGYADGDAVLRHRTGASTIANSVLGSAVAGQTDLFVLKLELNVSGGQDQVTVWLNPGDVATEGSTAYSAQFSNYSIVNQTDIDRLTFIVNNWGASSIKFDEARFGTTWDDVVAAVPEPASLGLVAIGASCIAIFRRRVSR